MLCEIHPPWKPHVTSSKLCLGESLRIQLSLKHDSLHLTSSYEEMYHKLVWFQRSWKCSAFWLLAVPLPSGVLPCRLNMINETKTWTSAIPIALNWKLGRPSKNWTCRFGQDRLPPRSGWWAEDPWSLTLNSMPGSEQSVLFQQLYFTLSGTLPISTEQTLMAGRLGRLVLQTNLEGIAWRNEGPKISCCLKEVTWELVPPWCSPLWCNRFTSRVWATSAPWTWSLSLPSLPRPWGLAGGSTTSHSPPGTCSPAWRIFEHSSHDSIT